MNRLKTTDFDDQHVNDFSLINSTMSCVIDSKLNIVRKSSSFAFKYFIP